MLSLSMDYITLLGMVAGFLTTIAFLPQVLRIWKLKEAKDISFATFLIFLIGIIIWLIYGILKSDLPIIIFNSITTILAGIILFFKLKYK